MYNFITPTTYEEARRMGVYWDWNSILLTNLGDRIRYIAIKLLEKGVSVEDVYEATGLPEKERKLKNTGYWEKICAAINDENTKMSVCFREIINERIGEIAKKLLIKRTDINLKLDDICNVTGLSSEQIEELRQEIAKLTPEEYRAYVDNLNSHRDLKNSLDCAKAEGKAEERFEIVKNAKALGLSIEQIQKLTNLTKEEIEKIK